MKKTITITNPKCLKCSKRETCNNKTFIFIYADKTYTRNDTRRNNKTIIK